MLAGMRSALTNCEIWIYDKSWCGCFNFPCCSRKPKYPEHLSNNTSIPPASQELENQASSPRFSIDLSDTVLFEQDVIPSPDPTSSVSIFQVPKMPQYADPLEDDFSN